MSKPRSPRIEDEIYPVASEIAQLARDLPTFDAKTVTAVLRKSWPESPERRLVHQRNKAAREAAAAVWELMQRPQPAVTLEEIEKAVLSRLRREQPEKSDGERSRPRSRFSPELFADVPIDPTIR